MTSFNPTKCLVLYKGNKAAPYVGITKTDLFPKALGGEAVDAVIISLEMWEELEDYDKGALKKILGNLKNMGD